MLYKRHWSRVRETAHINGNPTPRLAPGFILSPCRNPNTFWRSLHTHTTHCRLFGLRKTQARLPHECKVMSSQRGNPTSILLISCSKLLSCTSWAQGLLIREPKVLSLPPPPLSDQAFTEAKGLQCLHSSKDGPSLIGPLTTHPMRKCGSHICSFPHHSPPYI